MFLIYTRDVAIATLRSANIKHDQQQVWATQDLPIRTRARKNVFLLGLRWQFGEWEFVKRKVERDTNYAKMASAEEENMQFLSPQKKKNGRMDGQPWMKQYSVATGHGQNQGHVTNAK